MLQESGFYSYEEALRRAEAILKETSEEEECKTEKIEGLGRDILQDSSSNAFVMISEDHQANGYVLKHYSKDDIGMDRRTYIFRDVPTRLIPVIFGVFEAPIIKPTEEIALEEALTPEGIRKVHVFFNINNYDEPLLFTDLNKKDSIRIEDAFTYTEDTHRPDCFNYITLPVELSKRTGRSIESIEDYTNAMATIIEGELSEEEREQIKDSYVYYVSEAFRRYALYEFARTEDYSHLQEILSPQRILSSCKPFGICQELAERYKEADLRVIENIVLAQYLSKRCNLDIIHQQKPIKEVAEYTKTPLSAFCDVYKWNIKEL